MPDFANAAARHCRDAGFLHGDMRFASADHLAGLAAECGFKAILLRFLGASLTAKGVPRLDINGERIIYNTHVDKLWEEMSRHAAGRRDARFADLMANPNPFADWSIFDRYEDGSAVDAAKADNHLSAARQIVDLLQQGQLDGDFA